MNKTPFKDSFTIQTNERTYIIVPDDAVGTYDALWTGKSELIIGESHIIFQCPEVKRICVANWDTDGDGELSYTEAANVTDIGTKFESTTITSFDELRYFTQVTSMAINAFNGCRNLTSIIIPESVTSIGGGAFQLCSSLTSISIPESVTSIGNFAFDMCYNLKKVIIEDGSSSLDLGLNDVNSVLGLFNDCPLESVYLGRTVTSKAAAFPHVKEVILGDQVTALNYNLFKNCRNLTSISIPENSKLTTIGNYVFQNCSSLTSISIPEGVTSIGSYAFSGCSSLTSISIPKSVTSIGDYAFKDCSSLASVHITDIAAWCAMSRGGTSSNPLFYGAEFFLNGEKITNLVIPDGVTSIGQYAFYNYSELTSVYIPSSVTTIGYNAFNSTLGLIIFESETPIAYNSYSGSAVYVVPDDAVESYETAWANVEAYRIIGKSALEWKEVTCDAQPTTSHLAELIGAGNELNVTKLRIKGTINSYDMMVMRDKMQNLRELDLTDATIVANSYNYGTGVSQDNVFPDFMSGKPLTNLLLPTSITTIGKNALKGCGYIQTITIPDNVTSIGNNAFEGCNLLSTVNVTNESKLGTIGNYAFASMPRLQSIDLSLATQLTSLGTNAFRNSTIKTIALPASLEKIGACAFYECKSLISYASGATIEANAFTNCSALQTVTIEEGVTYIGVEAFKGCTALQTVTIKEGVTTIYQNAFEGCTALPSTSFLPESLTLLGASAFKGCTALKTITLPDALTSLGTYAFNGCTALEKAEIGMGITSVPQYLFSGCTALKEVKLSPKTTTIQSYAFQNCAGLTEFHLPPYLTTIQSNAFSGCSNLKEIYAYMPDVPAIAASTFSNYLTSTLYAPGFLFDAYYYDNGWRKFLEVLKCDLRPGDYEAFYTNKDLYFKEGEERITHDRPIVELGNQGSIIVEGENQEFTTVDMLRGTTSSSLIGDDNIVMDELRVKIEVSANRWYFLCFPYDVTISECTYPGKYAWRYYDGALRAANGTGGWQKIEGDVLKAGVGYIFQSNTAGNLIVKFAEPEFGGDRPTALTAHTSTNAANASWNFVGNPYTCYYNLISDDFASPITVWNGTTYVAYRPGDDNYHLQPYEAFFVQKTEDASAIDFKAEGRETYSQSVATATAQTRASFQRSITTNRLIVNLTISDNDTAAIDRTRLVMNNKASCNYELACDASKFISEDAAAQIYTLEGSVKMAINERPGQGKVRIGYTAQKAGTLRIEAQRMDSPMELIDTKTNRTFDLAQGAYEFTTEAGTFDNRFVICTSRGADEISNFTAATGVVIGMQEGGLNIGGAADKLVTIYGTNGTLVAEQYGNGYVALPSGIYVVKVDGHSAKMYVK